MKRILIITTVSTIYFAAVYFSDPFLIVLAFMGVLLIGILISVIATIVLIHAIHIGRSPRPASRVLGTVAIVVFLTDLAWPFNYFVQERAVAAAKAYPARVAPLLEGYRQTHGSYPASLDQLPSAPGLPRLLRKWGYRSDGRSYQFTFPRPGGFIDTWDYDSESSTWHLST